MKRGLALLFLVVVSCVPGWAQTAEEELRERLATAQHTDRVELLNNLARMSQGDRPQRSMEYAQQAIDLARRIRDREGEVNALNNLGIGHYVLSEYDEAMEYYAESLLIAETIDFKEGIANALNNTGVLFYVWGDYDRTLDYYSRALEIRKKIGDELGTAKCYNNLGNVYHATGRYDESLRHMDEALALYEGLGEEKLAGSTLANIGLAYHQLEQYGEARQRYLMALEIQERIGDKAGLAFTLNNLGMVRDEEGRPREALAYYERAMTVRAEIGDRLGEAICRLNIGKTQTALGDFGRALGYLDRALEMATEINVLEIQRDAHLALSETYEARGDDRQALDSYRSYKEVNDLLFDEKTGRKLVEMQTLFEVERKDRQIEVLRKTEEMQRVVRNVSLAGAVLLVVILVLLYNRYRLKDRASREMQKANEALHEAQAEREKSLRAELTHVSRVSTMGELAAALAHELNQPLTAILSNAQATRRLLAADRGDKQELDEALVDIVEGAGRSREIIQRLRKLIRRGEVAREPLEINHALRGVETFARADAERRKVRLVMDLGEDLPAVSGDRVQLQQVLLNLVHNGVEAMAGHAEGQSHLVVKTALHDEDTVLVSVRDSGPTLDEEVVERIFEPFFTTKKEGLGMGLTICSSIIEAHQGRMWATPNAEGGLTVQFTLPRSRVATATAAPARKSPTV